MGFDNDCILNIQSLAGEYFCPVCHLLVYPNEALQAQCTHLYCKPCLTYVVSTTHACPYDGYRVTEADSKPLLESNKALADTIGKIQVHCLYYRTGCTWQGPLSDCTSHCSTCAFGESPVQCNRCGIQIVHRQVQEHAQNCPGVQSQATQAGAGENVTSTGSGAASEQGQTAGQTAAPASQTQETQASGPSVSTQDTNQQANSAMQPQAAQATVPTPEQWYQQQQQYQQQYQQYYQQYPVYDPYQQHYQYYYQYPQAVQQYQQPPMQTYGQAQTQPQLQAQQQGQLHVQPYPQSQAQAPMQAAQPQAQPQAQPGVNTQPQVQSAGQAQSQMQAQSQGPQSIAVPYNQSQPLSQAQPYAQPQPVPQRVPVPQYQQAQTQAQHPYPQPYPQSQTQHYSQPQVPAQPHSQPNPQAVAFPPSQVNQPGNAGAQLQAQNAVTGYQSYPQPQLHSQAQVGAAHQIPNTGAQQQPQYPGQMQGQFPPQASQIRPPQAYTVVPGQHQPAMLSAQGQTPSGPPAQQLPVYPHAQQAGYPFQQRPGVQPAQHAPPQQYVQQQSFPGQGFFMQGQLQPQAPSQIQLQPPLPPQTQQNYLPPHGAPPNMGQSHACRQMVPQGAGPYGQGAGPAGSGDVRPTPSQPYPMRTNSQLSASEQQTVHAQSSLKTSGGEKLHDHVVDKGAHNQRDRIEEARDMVGASAAGSHVDEMKKVKSENGMVDAVDGNESKRDISMVSGNKLPGSNQVPGTQLKSVETSVQECKPGTNENTVGGVSEPSLGGGTHKSAAENSKDFEKAEAQELKHIDRGQVGGPVSASMLPQSHLPPQGHSSNSFPPIDQGRNQLQPMHYGSSAQQRPGLPSMPQSMPHPGNSQQSALRGHPPNQLRPQGPGHVPPRPPFNGVDNSKPPIVNNPPHENPPGGILGPGSAGAIARPASVGQYQGHVPPYQAGQPQNPRGEPFGGPSLAARPCAFDSHGSMGGRDPLYRPDMVQQRPTFPADLEKFPVQRPGYFDDRLPDSHSHAPMERGPYGLAPSGVRPDAVKFNGPLTHDPVHAPGMRDERFRPFPEEHLKPFPHREFEDDLRKFPRPPHLEAGPSKFGTQFPSSRPLDQGPHQFSVDGLIRPFEKGPHGLDHDSGLKVASGVGSGPSRFLPSLHPSDVGERGRPLDFPDDIGRADLGQRRGPGFGQHRMDGLLPRSPGRDYGSFPSRTFGGYRDIDGNESRSFEGSKPYTFPGEPFVKSGHESRFPVPPNHLHRSELDGPGNLRMGDHFFGDPHRRDMLPGHLRRGEHMGPRNLHLGEGAAFSRSAGPSRLGEPPLAGNLPQHLPFVESFGGEKPGQSFVGEPGYRGSYSFPRYSRDGGFYPGEMESFDNPRKRKPGSIMCRICKIECGTVEGLDLHSQSREHQRKAMDVVLSIKQQNKKKKTSKDQASAEEGRDGEKPKASSFENRAIKR